MNQENSLEVKDDNVNIPDISGGPNNKVEIV